LVYPDSSGSVNTWEHWQNLAESTQAYIDSITTWNTWSLTWNPGITSIGAGGFQEGFYMQIGKWVHAQFRIQIGTAPTLSGSTWVLNLPVTAYASWSGLGHHPALGSWLVRDNSAADYYSGTISADVASGVSCTFGGAWGGTSPNSRITSAIPVTFAVSDSLTGVLNYRAA